MSVVCRTFCELNGPFSAHSELNGPFGSQHVGTLIGVIAVRRVYEEPGAEDGARVLVDRLWPRGVRKDALAYDEWIKDVAPSSELRKWYGHDPARFPEFRRRYLAELDGNPAVDQLERLAADDNLTLLTATKDVERSHAAVLAEALEDRT